MASNSFFFHKKFIDFFKRLKKQNCVSCQTWNPEWGDPPQHQAILLTTVAQARVHHHPHFPVIYPNHAWYFHLRFVTGRYYQWPTEMFGKAWSL